jgi:hypothetical protein
VAVKVIYGKAQPKAAIEEADERIAAMQEENRQLRIELRAAQIREEIAMVMPHVLKPRAQKKTTDRGSRDSKAPGSAGTSGTKPSSENTGESTT